jgi:predicted glycosyltransferase involved in capsule biosynthesis
VDLSVIYPVHITFETRYILKRLETCLNNTCNGLANAEHIIALSGKPRYIKQAKHIINNLKLPVHNKIIIIDYDTPTTPYSPGIARNFAVKHCTKNHLLFWDIDLLGSEQLFKAIPNHIAGISKQTNRFEMYPCLYLCQQYTKNLKNYSNQTIEQAWVDATNLEVNSIEHFAMATSTILCNKQHFLDIGAFDEEFVGHMGEDLELLNRLSISYGKYDFENDHCEDRPSKIASELKGFRKHFLRYSVKNLNNYAYTIHLHHNTRKHTEYKKNNNTNRQKLLEKIFKQVQTKKNNRLPLKIELPFHLKNKSYTRQPFVDRFTRKVNKFILNPKKFFKDIK